MAYVNPSVILAIIVLLYLVSFVIFAIVRVATGISIQRIGYLSLRRIAYTPRDGIRIDIRGVGFSLHRPTFAQPTWVSLRLTEVKMTVDLKAVGRGSNSSDLQGGRKLDHATDGPNCAMGSSSASEKSASSHRNASSHRSQTWKRLTLLKERIKRLHEKIHWMSVVDVIALDSSLIIADVAAVQVGYVTMAVDTRRKTVDRSRLFQHKKAAATDRRPAEWIFNIRGVLFTSEGKESLEIIDTCSLNVHGLLYTDLAGLRDASISLKLGRVHIPYDDLVTCQKRVKHCLRVYGAEDFAPQEPEISLSDVMEELDMPGSREAKIVQTVSDSKEFISSILRGIQEIQMAVSYVGMTKELRSIQPSGTPLYVNFAMNEFGIDLHRLDPKSPAHRMYFPSKDIAHQALLAAISIAVSVDDGECKPERLLYVPMVTTTVKTTLPSKTVAVLDDKDAAARNANILFANIVVTSPSIDIDPKHMPIVFALTRSRAKPTKTSKASGHRHHLISRLLPKANIKFSIHEPVIRVALPPADPALKITDEYDLLISSISSIALDIESSHSSAGELHYSLSSNLRVSSHQLYYQNAVNERHNLLFNDALELKIDVRASPEVCVTATGNLETFSVHMVRPEISAGVRQIVRQLRKDTMPERSVPRTTSRDPSFLRRLPPWLVVFQFQGSDFGVEIAGIDSDVCKDSRGISLQLESWTAEYKIQKNAPVEGRTSRHRATSNHPAEANLSHTSNPIPQRTPSQLTDGRRLAVHVRGFEGFVIEGLEAVEPQSFLSLPRFEVALSASSDTQGPLFHVNSHVKALYVNYSLYNHYSLGVAAMVLKKAFAGTQAAKASQTDGEKGSGLHANQILEPSLPIYGEAQPELFTIDVKVSLLQVKARMPADPPLLLSVFGLEAGRHRWSTPFSKFRVLRLCAQAPQVKNAWARMATIKNCRIDLRQSRRKPGKVYIDEKSVDIATEFVRLAVPHQLILHKVFDNLANVLKASGQLHHRFRTGTNEYILKQRPEEPKRIPRISMRCRALLLELEDGPLDWKIGTIYRAGLNEQKQRLAREEAFNTKVKRLKELHSHRGSSRYRAKSSHVEDRARSKQSQVNGMRARSQSTERSSTRRSPSRPGDRGRRMRYDPEGTCGMSESAKISVDDAWYKVQEYNSRSWKKKVDKVMRWQGNAMRDIRSMFWGHDESLNDQDTERLLAMPARPGLMSTIISDLHVVVDKPSFPLQEYSHFLHRIGKGMPYDTQYSLLIPMSLQVDMGEARVTLRDYPLPLLHVPAIRPGQSPRLPSWSLKTDFVIAEEFGGSEAIKHVAVEIVPASKLADKAVRGGFAIDVRRTVSAVKTYSDVDISINTSAPTSFTWGTSYQPAIQDMMQIIEGFTKPQVDPSDRTGFWDKIRLVCHSRVNVSWKGDGDVHLKLKGTRNPYIVTGYGAGFVMCWRSNVRWGIHQDDDPRRFMTVNSGEYVLAIPDYSHQARQIHEISGSDGESASTSSSSSTRKNSAMFKKVIMKLSGNVQWMAGLVFERNLDRGGRSFHFTPHYKVTLKTPEHAKASNGEVYDAFRGFRSHYIHMSIAVSAPLDRDWSTTNLKPAPNYNTVHLSPRFFTHFFDWWSMFSGVMALPIRQGKLFPGVEKSSKKFGRHLATIKYNLLLSPLFIAHIYKHKDAEDYSEDAVGATGLKVRIDSFMLDLHQRREEFPSQVKGNVKQIKTSGMRINEAQLDFISADIRAVSASISGTSAEDLKRATDEDLASYQESAPTIDMSKFTIPDHDFSWIDMDDFVELDWILPAESNPETCILPLAFAPRFTYFRQTDHIDSISGDPDRYSSFGNEPTHHCVMSQDNDPRRVQCDLIKDRLKKIDEQMETHKRTLGEQELRVVRDGHQDRTLKEHFDMLTQQSKALDDKKQFLQQMLTQLLDSIKYNENYRSNKSAGKSKETNSDPQPTLGDENMGAPQLADFESDFNNRFIIHNAQVKWNNSLRNIILRYAHQVSQRRGFVYYMSRRAVKFILDIVQDQSRAKYSSQGSEGDSPISQASPLTSTSKDNLGGGGVDSRIQELLNDGKKFVDADDTASETGDLPKMATDDLGMNISEDFAAQNAYYVRFFAPQIQLQSEKNAKSVLIVSAKSMQLQVIQIMDKDRMSDDVSGLVQRRFSVDMDSIQFFVTNQKTLTQFIHLYSASRYGTPKGSAWPPWLPIEVNYDFQYNPFGFSRVIQKTSAKLRYDKYNSLRLKYNDEVSSEKPSHVQTPAENAESRIDHAWIEFPHIRAVCDSSQYYAMYLIVLDLLLYSEPLEKIRSEKLEKIMLASDFSDLRGAPEMVISLQERIQQLEEIKNHFQIHASYLDRKGWQDRLLLERDLTSCEDELFFMMKAITTSQRKNDDRNQAEQTNGLLTWYLSASEIVWHLMKGKSEPLMEIQLKKAAYERTDNSDGSNHNNMVIERINGLNLLPDALYPEMLAPYHEPGKPIGNGDGLKVFKVQWIMLEAIAGIPVLDQFEVNLFPLKVQLEREIGKKLFDYIFPGSGPNGAGDGSKSPFLVKHMQPIHDDDDGDSETEGPWSVPETPQLQDDQNGDYQPRAGSLEMRLKPTVGFPDNKARPNSSTSSKHKHGLSASNQNEHQGFRFFHHSNKSHPASRPSSGPAVSKRSSRESLKMTGFTSRNVSSSNLPGQNGKVERHKKFALHRSKSRDSALVHEKTADDLTQMLSRASNYMTLAYVKIPSVVLCLSYKGRGERNIEDVHNFVFRMPDLEYRNKTWSNLDLALRLKKDVIKALISHTGAIIGNKFTHHRPNKQQQSRLRELAKSSLLLPNTDNLTNASTNSESSSVLDQSPSDDQADTASKFSSASGHSSHISRAESWASSSRVNNSSYISRRNGMFDTDAHFIPESEAEEDDKHNAVRGFANMRDTFTRRFTGENQIFAPRKEGGQTNGIRNGIWNANGSGEGVNSTNDESTRRKGVKTLGKKFLGQLN